MNNWYEKKRLADQLKFFNYKPKRFISCYAKKPRISMKVEVIVKDKFWKHIEMLQRTNNIERLSRNELYRDQLNRGTQHTSLGYQQMVLTNMSAQQSQFGFLCGQGGGLAGLGLGGCLGLGGSAR